MATLVQVAPGLYVRVDTPRRVEVAENTIKRLAGGSRAMERVIRQALGRRPHPD